MSLAYLVLHWRLWVRERLWSCLARLVWGSKVLTSTAVWPSPNPTSSVGKTCRVLVVCLGALKPAVALGMFLRGSVPWIRTPVRLARF
jgi:hypothetical protein